MSLDAPLSPDAASPAEAIPSHLASAEALRDALWSGFVKAALKKASKDPYVETQDCYLAGRDGIGTDKIQQMLATSFYEATDEWGEGNEDYVERERRDASERVIKEALGEPAARALLAQAAEAWDEDEDDLEERLVEELQELGREEGLDYLYDVTFELRGSVEAQWEESFHLPCDEGAQNEAFLPLFNESGSEWVKVLLTLGVEPAVFFNLCREKAKDNLARLREETAPSDWPDCEAAGAIRAWLKDQGLSRPCPKAPASWPAELWEAMKGAARECWSFPKGPAACSPEDLFEALSKAQNDNPSFSMELSLAADDLTQSSMLIDRFSEGGPILAPRALAQTQEAHPGALYVDGEPLNTRGPVTLAADALRFTEYSGDSGSLGPSARALRSEAWDMEMASRSPGGHYFGQAEEEDFAEEIKQGAERARAYGSKATREGLAQAEARIKAWSAPKEPLSAPLAQERSELYSALLLAQLHQGAAKNASAKEKTAARRLPDLLDITPFGLRQSSWRSEASRLLQSAQKKGRLDQKDEFGNTLLRKAILSEDESLCEDLLRRGADPAASNLVGDCSWSALARLSAAAQLKMAKRLAPFGAAQWRDANGKTWMHLSSSAQLACELARQGADPSATDRAGVRADSRIYSERDRAEVEAAYLESVAAVAPARAKGGMSL